MMGERDEKMGWKVGGPAQAEVEPLALGRVARGIIERQPLNPFKKLELKPIKSWSGSMVESNRERA